MIINEGLGAALVVPSQQSLYITPRRRLGVYMWNGQNEFSQYLELMEKYAKLGRAYQKRGVSNVRDPEDKENPIDTPEHQKHYKWVGESALRIIVDALVSNGRDVPRSILDFPSGSGRVTRHLCAMFPEARIAACDLYPAHIEFCAKTFNVEPLLSREDIENLDIGSDWDLIFCGSLLTHLPGPASKSALRFIARSLSDRGIAVVTTHGRYVDWREKNGVLYLEDKLFRRVRAGFEKTGFGYSPYEPRFKMIFNRQAEYGVNMMRPNWIVQAVEEIPDVAILGFTERAWDFHQDAVIFGKPGINAP